MLVLGWLLVLGLVVGVGVDVGVDELVPVA